MRRTLLAAACGCIAALACAAPALAEPGVVPAKATNYAAGDLKGSFTNGTTMLSSLGLRSGGKKIDILVRVAGGESSPCSHIGVGGATASIRRDGTFATTVKFEKPTNAAAGSATVKGEFVEDENAGAVIDLTIRSKTPTPAGKTCDSGTFDLVGINPAKGLSGEAGKKAFFVGLLEAKSSIVPVKLPILMRLSSNGKALDTAATTVSAKCQAGGQPTYGLLAVTNDALNGDKLAATDTSLMTGSTERSIVSTKLNGTFGATKFAGTFQVTATIQDAAGTTTKDVCDSGAVKATLTRVR
jgi:hypothetical protein